MHSRKLALAVVLAVLALPALALAGDRHQQRATRRAVEHQAAGPVEVLAGLWQQLVNAWEAAGVIIDPNGGGEHLDPGPIIDPNGGPSLDPGVIIDPNG